MIFLAEGDKMAVAKATPEIVAKTISMCSAPCFEYGNLSLQPKFELAVIKFFSCKLTASRQSFLRNSQKVIRI